MSADEFLTIIEPGHAQTRVLGSRFFGRAISIRDMAGAYIELAVERKQYHDATHWCHAIRLGWGPGLIEKSSDDGEPHGTAGIPILREMQGRRITNALVIVTRYFGGTKLGTGNLARAYAGCAALSLECARTDLQQCRVVLRVWCPPEQRSLIHHLARRFGADLRPDAESDEGNVQLHVPVNREAEFRHELHSRTRGRVIILESDA